MFVNVSTSKVVFCRDLTCFVVVAPFCTDAASTKIITHQEV